MDATPAEIPINLCHICQEVDNALRNYYAHHRDGTYRQWLKQKFTLGTVDELSKNCGCCRDIAASLPAFQTPYGPANIFRIVIDDTDIMLKYKLPRNMRSDFYTDHLYLLPAQPISASLEHATPYDPTHFNPEVAQRWINRCSSRHGEGCNPPKIPLKSLMAILLVDVVDRCLVAASPDARYIALSYCWGQSKTVRAFKSNISLLLTPGSLSLLSNSFRIPPTIADAITFVQNIGERYLWVDSLCIVQDDDGKKQLHLENMAFIYANSFLTLVAADGPNVDHGLPGVDKYVRKRNLPLYKIHLPSGILVLNQPRANLRPDSVWNSRGWTLQESLFSTRMIIFDKFVSWVCCRGEWAEDTDREGIVQWPVEKPKESSSGFMPVDRVGLLGRFPPWPDLRTWGNLVEQFNKRNLTFEKDVIDAFAGIAAAVGASFPQGFLLGLPQLFFDIALLWQPERKLQRRQAASVHLPSWSWVGWKGEIETHLWDVSNDLPYHKQHPLPTLSVEPLVQWKAIKSARDTTYYNVLNSYHLYRSGKPSMLENELTGWTSNLECDGTNRYYTHRRVQGEYFRYRVPISEHKDAFPLHGHCYLSFESMRSWFKMGGILEDRFVQQEQFGSVFTYNVAILDVANNKVGFLRLNEEDVTQAPIGEKCELIAISAGTVPIAGMKEGLHTYLWQKDEWALGHWHESAVGNNIVCEDKGQVEGGDDGEWEDVSNDVYRFYNVLWIEWAAGITYRKALGRVIQEAWDVNNWDVIRVILG